MTIQIIGGGPAGLYFALLMKKRDPACRVTVFERDGPDDTFGWGIVFSARTLAMLAEHDPESHAEIARAAVTWEYLVVVHRGQRIAVGGNHFVGIGRLAFLNILHRRCQSLGVDLRFRTNVDAAALAALPPADLVVAADGANSLVRRHYAAHFRPELGVGRNKYIWLGTPHLFDGLTLTFRAVENGVYAAHSYPFSSTRSTFIVECDAQTWQRAGYENMSPEGVCAALADLFADDLHGQPLLSNNFVRWLNFPLVRNACWRHGHIVLLGDALHTAHFSIGSGTKLALEDAVALAGCADRFDDVPAALDEFERRRRPDVDAFQAAAESSLRLFENLAERMLLSPIDLAYQLMTRSGRISHEQLRKRDPDFVAVYERTRAHSTP